MPQGTKGVETIFYGRARPGAFERDIHSKPICFFLDNRLKILLTHVDYGVGSDSFCQFKAYPVCVCPGHDCLESSGDEQFQTQQSHRARTRYEHDIPKAERGQIAYRMYNCRQRLADGAFVQWKVRCKREQLVRPNHYKTGKGAVDSVAHAPSLRTKHEFTLTAVDTLTASDRGSSQNTISVSPLQALYTLAGLDDGRRDFMTENDGWKIAKGVMKNVKIGSTHSTPGNFKLHLIVAARGLFHFAQFNVAGTFCEFYESFHSTCQTANDVACESKVKISSENKQYFASPVSSRDDNLHERLLSESFKSSGKGLIGASGNLT